MLGALDGTATLAEVLRRPPGRPAGLARGDRRTGRRRPGRSAPGPSTGGPVRRRTCRRWPTASVRRPPTGSLATRQDSVVSRRRIHPGGHRLSPRCSSVPASGTSTTAPTAPSNRPTCPPATAVPRPPGPRAGAGPRPRTPTSLARLLRRHDPRARTEPPAGQTRADLHVLAVDGPVDPTDAAPLATAGLAHLQVWAGPARAVVGPLVLPGRSTCLHCADLHRADADPHAATVARARRALPTESGAASAGRGHRRRGRPGPAAARRRGTAGDGRRHAGVGSGRPMCDAADGIHTPSVGVALRRDGGPLTQ